MFSLCIAKRNQTINIIRRNFLLTKLKKIKNKK